MSELTPSGRTSCCRFRTWSRQSLLEESESIEGLTINLAIVHALVLTLIVTCAIEFPQRELLKADLLGLLCSSQNFREFAVDTLEQNYFNLTRRVAEDRILDMSQWLLVDASKHPKVGGADYSGTFGGVAVAECNGVAEMSATYELVASQFPLDEMLAWHAWNRADLRFSDTATWYTAVAAASSCSGLVISIMLYTSLMTSPVRTKDRALKVWLRLGFPATILNVFIMVVALAFGYNAFSWYLISVSTDWMRYRQIWLGLAGAYTSLPVLVVSAVVGVVSTAWARMAMGDVEEDEGAEGVPEESDKSV